MRKSMGKSGTLFIFLMILLGFTNVKVCFARSIDRKLQLNYTETGTIVADSFDDLELDEQEDDKDYDFSHYMDGKLKLKFTITLSNIEYYILGEYGSIYITLYDSSSYGSKPLWNQFFYVDDFKKNETITVSKEIVVDSWVSLFIGGAKENEIESFDYSLTTQDLTLYSEQISMQNTLNMETKSEHKISYRNVYPGDALNAGITWTSSNKNVAKVDETGEVTAIKPGTSLITATLKNGKTYTCLVKVKNPKPYINTKNVKMCISDTYKLKINYNSKKVKWISSNKKVATVSSKGKIRAKGIGSCKITAKIGKKKYTCKVKVVRQWPNYAAVLQEYNTRDNYFVVAFYNKSNKNLIIQPGSAKVEHVAYKSYDRYLTLEGGKDIVISPKKFARIKFYVNGSITWFQVERYTLFYRMKFDGVSYEAHTWYSDSGFKMGSGWYHTYTADDWYHDWKWLK